MDKMRQKIKKFIAVTLLGLQAFVLIVGLLYLALGSDHVRSMTAFGSDSVSYVLVNEDLGSVLNGVEYNLGSEFVTLISQDTENRWQTASRTVAEAGFRSGSFDVMIILPQNFSERLLSLQSFTPEQAQIVYEVRMGYNELANMAIREQVSEILDDFNQRIVQMYFSSILGNLFDAQLNVGSMIDDEQSRHALFLDFIQDPFNALPDFFLSVVDDTLFLESETDSWQRQQGEFSESAQQILTNAAEDLTEQLAEFDGYIDVMQLLSEMNRRNAQFAVDSQAEADEAFYRDQFSGFNQKTMSGLGQFYNEDSSGNTVLGRFKGGADHFYQHQSGLRDTLDYQIGWVEDQAEDLLDSWAYQLESLEAEAEELLVIREAISLTFFADADLSPREARPDDIRQAIINLMAPRDDYDTTLDDVYLETLRIDIGQLALDDLEGMVSHLRDRGLIGREQYTEYLRQIELVRRYAGEEGIRETNVDFVFIDAEEGEHPPYEIYPHTATFEIFPTTESATRIRLISGSDIEVEDIWNVVDQLQAQIDVHLFDMNYGLDAVVRYEGDGELSISFYDSAIIVMGRSEVCELTVTPRFSFNVEAEIDEYGYEYGSEYESGYGYEPGGLIAPEPSSSLIPPPPSAAIYEIEVDIVSGGGGPDFVMINPIFGPMAINGDIIINISNPTGTTTRSNINVIRPTANWNYDIEVDGFGDFVVTIKPPAGYRVEPDGFGNLILDPIPRIEVEIDLGVEVNGEKEIIINATHAYTAVDDDGDLVLTIFNPDEYVIDLDLPTDWVYRVVIDDGFGNSVITIRPPANYEVLENDDGDLVVREIECEVCAGPASFTVSADMNLVWYFSDAERRVQFGSQDFAWVSCTERSRCQRLTDSGVSVIFASQLAYFTAFDGPYIALVEEDLGALLEQLNLLGGASRQIVTLFGAPTTRLQTVNGFLRNLNDDDGIRAQAHPDSIYHRYGDLSTDEKQHLIADSLIELFREHGTFLYNEVTGHYDQVVAIINANTFSWEESSLNDVLEALSDPALLLDEAQLLLAWHLETLGGVGEFYQSWSAAEILEIMLAHHSGGFDLDATSATIYFDERTSQGMLSTFGLILSMLQGDSDLILSGDLELRELEEHFARIVGQTEDVQSLTEAILSDMGLLSEQTDASVEDNLAFADHFSQVMENARIGGTDNPDVLSFLASPVHLVGSYDLPMEVSFVPYYLTIISVILSFAVGYGLRYFWKKREQTTVDKLVKRGLIWKNAPFVIKLSAASLCIGLIFSGVSAWVVGPVSTITWMLYVSTLIMTSILVISYLARQIPRASLFIVGAIIAAYLLLNPVLGVQVEAGTFVAWLFRLSPLYHVEHLFTRLVAGDFLSILDYVGLITLTIAAVVLNLLVFETKAKAQANVDGSKAGELAYEK